MMWLKNPLSRIEDITGESLRRSDMDSVARCEHNQISVTDTKINCLDCALGWSRYEDNSVKTNDANGTTTARL
jgi:hypothetical protein